MKIKLIQLVFLIFLWYTYGNTQVPYLFINKNDMTNILFFPQPAMRVNKEIADGIAKKLGLTIPQQEGLKNNYCYNDYRRNDLLNICIGSSYFLKETAPKNLSLSLFGEEDTLRFISVTSTGMANMKTKSNYSIFFASSYLQKIYPEYYNSNQFQEKLNVKQLNIFWPICIISTGSASLYTYHKNPFLSYSNAYTISGFAVDLIAYSAIITPHFLNMNKKDKYLTITSGIIGHTFYSLLIGYIQQRGIKDFNKIAKSGYKIPLEIW